MSFRCFSGISQWNLQQNSVCQTIVKNIDVAQTQRKQILTGISDLILIDLCFTTKLKKLHWGSRSVQLSQSNR
jgi:hypothetical protein